MDFMIPYGVLLYQSSAESLRCLPVFAVRRGCVVRITYESFLDYSLQEFFMFLEWRTAIFRFSLRFQYDFINTSVKGDSLSPLTISLRRAEPARPQFAYGGKTVSGLHGFAFLFFVVCIVFLHAC